MLWLWKDNSDDVNLVELYKNMPSHVERVWVLNIRTKLSKFRSLKDNANVSTTLKHERTDCIMYTDNFVIKNLKGFLDLQWEPNICVNF